MTDSTDEKHLLVELKSGSFLAFETLYNMYSGKLYNFIMRISSNDQYMTEEVVQSTFVRVWEVRETINPNLPFISFLCTIAKNMLKNMYQRKTVEFVYNQYLIQKGEGYESEIEENVDLQFLNEYVDCLTEKLPPQRKKIFRLSRNKCLNNKEIAKHLGISESTVATQLSLAIKFMREQLIKHCDTVVALLMGNHSAEISMS